MSLEGAYEEAKRRLAVACNSIASSFNPLPIETSENKRSNKYVENNNGGKTVLCVAAATVELSAIFKHLAAAFGEPETVPIDDGQEYLLSFVDTKNSVTWNLLSLSFQGQAEAAAAVKGLCYILKPTIVLMVGMCMSMPNKALPVGTVVIPNEVTVFDHVRLTAEGVQHRPHGDRVDNGMFKLARVFSVKKQFPFKVITDKGLASATSKVENVKSELITFINSSFPDAVAFDMEGWGFYRAGAGQQCLWIKAIADAGEAQQMDFSHQMGKHATQEDVTGNAVEFAIGLVEEFIKANKL